MTKSLAEIMYVLNAQSRHGLIFAEMQHRNRLGPIYIGTILNVALYGIMITQVYLYFSNYKKYVRRIMAYKALIVDLLLFTTAVIACGSRYLYVGMRSDFG